VDKGRFDASRYVTKLNGRDYLEVKWRLLWLRTEHPEAAITTELARLEDGLALFRAKVSLPEGGEATGWGSETADDFEDYIEKAETKALGRALAALGFGTQFCEDFDFATENQEKVVDSPVTRPRPTTQRGGEGRGRASLRQVVRQAHHGAQDTAATATASQLRAIYAIARADWGLSEAEVNERCRQDFGCLPQAMSKEQASAYITQLRKQPAPSA